MAALILNYVSGGCLEQKLKTSGIQSDHVAKLMLSMLSGLVYLHKNLVVVWDMKPDNILINADGEAVWTDFGLSIKLPNNWKMQILGGGNLLYMAPERLISPDSGIFDFNRAAANRPLQHCLNFLADYYTRRALQRNNLSSRIEDTCTQSETTTITGKFL